MLDLKQPTNPFNNQSNYIDGRAHILYIYNEIDKYIANAFSFILEGLSRNEVIAFVDTDEVVAKIKGMMAADGLEMTSFPNLFVMESKAIYLLEDEFDLQQAQTLIKQITPFLEKGSAIRTWGNVPFPEFHSTLERIKTYEVISDELVSHNKLIAVCAYNGLLIPAYVQNELIRSHSYFMTDHDFAVSPLYQKENVNLSSSQEIERLRTLQQQNQHLTDLNNQLKLENNLVKVRNDLVIQSEQRIRSIIEQLPIPTIIRKGTSIFFLNGEAKKQFRGENETIEKKPLSSFFEDYDQMALTEAHTLQNYQFTFQNDVTQYYLVKSIQLVYENEPAILHALVDLTYEKENESLVVRSEKMNIVGELAASIAHELRNPLTAIKGFFKILRTSTEEKELYYNVIDGELSRIEQISSELLTLAKPHAENKTRNDLIQLIEDVIVLLTPQANMKNIEIVKNTNCESFYLNCESTKIKQVFINLIKNSIDAMESSGQITIDIEEKKDRVHIKISDQGCGIPKTLLDKLGEPFYTTKEKGTGLGLMVCFQIIESHSGSIHVDSVLNAGTTFTLTLPAK